MEPSPIRLVVVDDDETVRRGLRAVLGSFSNRVDVVGDAATADEAWAVVDATVPDVVLFDVRLRPAAGLELCRALTARARPPRVVLLSVYDDEQYLLRAVRLGAAGYLRKHIGGDELVRNLEVVHGGGTVVDPVFGPRAADDAARVTDGRHGPAAGTGPARRGVAPRRTSLP